MPVRLPEPNNTYDYTKIPFEFSHELTAANVFLQLPDGFSPLERMVLQTTGNLQRLLSAYFNVHSEVVILKNEITSCYQDNGTLISSTTPTTPPPLQQQKSQKNNDGTVTKDEKETTLQDIDQERELDLRFERKVKVYFGKKLAYEAVSLVSVKDHQTLSLLAKHKYGLGQIFSRSRHSPKFALLAVGRHGSELGQSFWRDYTLSSPGVIDCYIRETFVDSLFEQSVENNSIFNSSNSRQGTVWYYPGY